MDNKSTRHISSYDDYDALMARVTGKLWTVDPPRIEMDYNVGGENDNLDFAWGKDGVVRAYSLGQHSVNVIQIITIAYNGHRTNIEGSAGLEPGWFDSSKFSQALLVTEFSKDDIAGSTTHVTGRIITADDETSRVIGVFEMDADKGMWHNIANGLAWTYETVGGAAGAVGDGLGVVGGNLGESFAANVAAAGSGIRDGAVIIGNGLGDAGGAIGDGLGAAVGGATNFVGDIMYNMTARALYESGYIQAAATIAIILVAIDLRKNKII